MGIIVSFVAVPLMKYTHVPVSASIDGLVIAFLFAVLTSTVFGFYPANKAAGLKPIDALNFE